MCTNNYILLVGIKRAEKEETKEEEKEGVKERERKNKKTEERRRNGEGRKERENMKLRRMQIPVWRIW